MNILSRPVLPADRRILYGPEPCQFGDLWLPEDGDRGRFPVVVFFHGGWWKSEYDLGYAGYMCAALKQEGIATWSVEYRRLGATGGGWPMTYLDAADGLDFLPMLAKQYPLDLSNVVTMGHSAGAHLAFWNAGREHVAAESEIFSRKRQVSLRGAISLAGAVDLRLTIRLSGNSIFAHDREEVYALMGGPPEELPKRYSAGNPGDLLPFQAPQFLIQGNDDDQIPPELPRQWASLAGHSGSQASIRMIPGADHFDVIDPTSDAWKIVLTELKSILRV